MSSVGDGAGLAGHEGCLEQALAAVASSGPVQRILGLAPENGAAGEKTPALIEPPERAAPGEAAATDDGPIQGILRIRVQS